MPGPHEVRVALLVTCTLCNGEQLYETQEDGICACPRCEGGWQGTSVPASVFLNAHRPEVTAEQSYTELAECIRAQEPTGHSMLRHLTTDLPLHKLEKIRRQQL